jgi:hypothetical protein
MGEERPDALFVLDDALTQQYRKEIADFAMQKHLRACLQQRIASRQGG